MEEMDVIFGAVDAAKRQADIEAQERALVGEKAGGSPDVGSLRSDLDQKV